MKALVCVCTCRSLCCYMIRKVPKTCVLAHLIICVDEKYSFLTDIMPLTLFILMDYPIRIDTTSMELSFLYLKVSPDWGHRSKFLLNDVFLSLKIVIILANSAHPDEMPPYVAFIWVFTFCQITCLQVSRVERVKILMKMTRTK